MFFLLNFMLFSIVLWNLSPQKVSSRNKDYVLTRSTVIMNFGKYIKLIMDINKNRSVKNSNSNLTLMYIVILLMAVSNDVETNPGPEKNNSTIYPCGTCDKPVTWDHRAIVCDTCDQWYHTSCQDVHTGTYSILNEDSAIRWDCIICNSPNYSTICFDLHSLCSENPYSILSISSSSIPSPSINQHLKPQHSSTPERKCQQSKETPKHQPPLRILNINCQSIKKKQDRIENIIDCTKPDVVIATETWLDPSITDNQIFPSNFKLWRNDRRTGPGGGVLLAIRDTFLSSDVPELQTDCEITWAKINLVGSKTLLLCSYYNPKTSDEHSLQQFEESIRRAATVRDTVLVVGGDFNLPGWDWKSKTLNQNTQHPRLHYMFSDCLDDNGLTQLVEEPTRNKNTLDLLITNLPSKVLRTSVMPGISDHDAVLMEFDMRPVTHKQIPRQIPLYKNARWDGIKADMSRTYDTIKKQAAENKDINTLWTTFKNNLKDSIKNHIPHKTAKPRDSFPWITNEIKRMIKKRNRPYVKKKKSNHPAHVKQYKEIKQQVQKKLRQAYWSYIDNMFSAHTSEADSNKSLPKKFWTFIKHKKKDNTSISGLRNQGQLYTDAKSKATILNQQFQSAFSESTPCSESQFKDNHYMTSDTHPIAPEISISRPGVEKLLNSLNTHKAAGPDSIHPRILKEMSPSIAPILTVIFNHSISTGDIPSDWRTANVAPIYKKGSRYNPENYRPISLTCICCKLLEHCITSHIMKHGEHNNFLYPLQHGFRKGGS